MKLATRLWLAIIAAVVLLLSTIALVERRHEEEVLIDVTTRDRRFFAHTLQAALSFNPGGSDPVSEARAMIARHDLIDTHATSQLVSLGGPSDLKRPDLDEAQHAALVSGEVVVKIDGDEVLTYVPLSSGEFGIAVEFTESHAPYQSIESVSLYGLATQLSAVGCVAGLIMFVLVRLFVATPIAALTSLTREIAAGNLSARTPVISTPELNELAGEMNRMAESLQKARLALEESEAERVGALENLRHADRLRTVGQLASALAHELGTPLNIVSGYARMIESESELAPEHRAHGQVIHEQVQRMADIVRRLLDYSRREPPRTERIDLSSLVLRAAGTLEPLSRKRGVRVRVTEPEQSVHVIADGHHLLQVFTNLMVNAIHASENASLVQVDIEVRFAKPPVGKNLRAGKYAVIALHDQGSGIAKDDLPRLFEPFFTRKPSGEGTGLGLSVAQGIVAEHRGWIEVESTLSVGTTFRVFLPAENPNDAEFAAQSHSGRVV
jgi:signal transduction histidine kinase